MSEVRDRWAAGSTYEDFMGRLEPTDCTSVRVLVADPPGCSLARCGVWHGRSDERNLQSRPSSLGTGVRS